MMYNMKKLKRKEVIKVNEHERIILDDNKKIIDAFERDSEDDKNTKRAIRKICTYANPIYIFLHVIYVIFFFSTGYNLMGYINVASVLYYSLLYILFKLDRFDIYVLLCGIEISVNMSASTILFGLDAGFHLILIALCAVAFFTSYFSVKARGVIKPVYWAGGLLIECILLYLWNKFEFTKPYYTNIPDYINIILYIAHITVAFVITSSFLYYFVTYIRKLEKRVLRDSKTDRLTQIGNRKALDDYVASLDLKKEKYALTIFDIDNFKNVNDQYGHLCGDYILKEIADICLLAKQPDDFVVRFGGEEFIFISKVDESFDKTCEIMDEFRKKVEEHRFEFEGFEHHITVTMGISLYEEGLTLDDWVRKSDIKLYSGKANGKNKLVR